MNSFNLFFKSGLRTVLGNFACLVLLPVLILAIGQDRFISASNFVLWLYIAQAAPLLAAVIYYGVALSLGRSSETLGGDRGVWIGCFVLVLVIVGGCAIKLGSMGEDWWLLPLPVVAFYLATAFFAPASCKYAAPLAGIARKIPLLGAA